MSINRTTNHWPAFLVALVLAFAAFSWWSLERAASGVSPVTDPNYYRHGLKYNSTSLELQSAQTLGWTVRPKLQGRILTVQVDDADQTGIPGCQGAITLHTETATPPLALSDAGHGLYTATIPANLPLTLEASLTLTKAQATVQRRLLISLEP